MRKNETFKKKIQEKLKNSGFPENIISSWIKSSKNLKELWEDVKPLHPDTFERIGSFVGK